MFEYDAFLLKIYGFLKIKHLDENRLEFIYKHKNLVVHGKALKVMNLLDKSVEVKGLVEGININYLGDKYD